MVLSILIPVFNWDISALLERLLAEIDASALEDRVEVVVFDDSSTDAALREGNAAFVARHPRRYLRYRALQQNRGRAVIRNLLAAEAAGDFLLFLDCDVLPDSGDFVGRYLACVQEGNCDVACGGISYRTRVLHEPQFDYHAYLGRKKEVRPAAQRNLAPWRFILTSNIMVRKGVFLSTPFDERFTGYGYEDIEWGVRLARQYRIVHIDNTASHLGLVSKGKAYDKMRDSVPNYLLLRELCPAAFHASLVSRLVSFFSLCGAGLLTSLDRALGRLFTAPALGNRVSFIVFQLNFAVLLALSLKGRTRQGKGAP